MSAVGTTPLQSPGCNEGKARNGTLGKHGYKKIRAPQERHYNASICLGLLGVPPLWGSIDVFHRLTQGLRPGLCRSIALTGLIYVFTPPNQLLCCFDAVALHLSWNYSILWMSLRIFVDDLWFKSIT